jgi:hypothetical protein
MMGLPKFEYRTPQTIVEAVKVMAAVARKVKSLPWYRSVRKYEPSAANTEDCVISVIRIQIGRWQKWSEKTDAFA